AGVEGRLVADVRPAAGHVLPAVAGAAVGPGGHVDLGGGALPADVTHVGGAGLEGVPLVQGQQEAVHGVARLRPPGLDVRRVVRVVLAAHAGGPVAAGVGLGQAVGKGQLLRRVAGDPQGLEVPVEEP